MVLLTFRRIPIGPKIRARVGDQAHIMDVMQDMQITPGQLRQQPEKEQVHLNIYGMATFREGLPGKGPFSGPNPNRHLFTHP